MSFRQNAESYRRCLQHEIFYHIVIEYFTRWFRKVPMLLRLYKCIAVFSYRCLIRACFRELRLLFRNGCCGILLRIVSSYVPRRFRKRFIYCITTLNIYIYNSRAPRRNTNRIESKWLLLPLFSVTEITPNNSSYMYYHCCHLQFVLFIFK